MRKAFGPVLLAVFTGCTGPGNGGFPETDPVPPFCAAAEAYSRRCVGALVQECDGRLWHLLADCAVVSEICVAVEGSIPQDVRCAAVIAACAEDETGNLRCGAGDTIEECNGTGWFARETCGNPKPLCLAGLCVECVDDDQCSCHETCSSHSCTPLGASDLGHRENAHGNWQGTPGTAGYTYVGDCVTSDECEIGEICNPFTAGCILAADFQTPCGPNATCTGALACEPTTQKCLPAALCQDTRNCCGFAEMACGISVPRVCERTRTECTPPAAEEVTNTCPFDPKTQDTCFPGLWCAPLGRCVQCQCDEDCAQSGGLPRCYAATGRCVGPDYCTQANDCDEPLESCDRTHQLCKPRCDDSNDCLVDEEYCDNADAVCRDLSSLPCTPDAYEPNNSMAAAVASDATLPVPAMSASVTVADLTLCDDDHSDWYRLPLARGDRIVMRGTTAASLTAELNAVAPDGITLLATGTIDLVSQPLDFTANYTDTYFIAVTGYGSGRYSLELDRTSGATCDDAFELPAPDGHGPNNTVATATVMDAAAGGGSPPECDDTTVGETRTIACLDGALKLCDGDVDFYVVEAPANTGVEVTVENYGGDLDLYLYGPFFAGDTIDTDHSADTATTGGSDPEIVVYFSRPAAKYLVRVVRYSGAATGYDLTIALTSGPSCTEDAYDAAAAAVGGSAPAPLLVVDPAGLNDTFATASYVSVEGPTANAVVTVDDLLLCKGDVDWFRVGLPDTGTPGALTNLPGDMRFKATLVATGAPSSDEITLAGGSSPSALSLGSTDPAHPQTEILIPHTDGNPLYFEIVGAVGNTAAVPYRLDFEYMIPATCDPDGLGDTGGSNNDLPANAKLLEGADGWPTVVHTSHSATALTLCAADDDWYRLAVPANTAPVVTVRYDPSVADVGLALFNSTVLSSTSFVQGVPPDTGLVSSSAMDGRDLQRVRGNVAGDAYIMVYNRTGWPLLDYTLEVQLIPTGCFIDAYEPNGTWDAATALPMVPVVGSAHLQVGRLDLGTVCSSTDTDWYSVNLQRGDVIDVYVYYVPNEGNLDLYLHGPGPGGVSSYLKYDYDDYNSTGILDVHYTVDAYSPLGDYLLKVEPYSTGGSTFSNIYFIEAFVARSCSNDPLEPSSSTQPRAITVPFDSQALSPPGLVLCGEEDWYAVDLSVGQTITACATFTNSAGNVDLSIYNNARDSFMGSASATNNYERVIYTAAETQTHFIKVYLSTPANTAYDLKVTNGIAACP